MLNNIFEEYTGFQKIKRFKINQLAGNRKQIQIIPGGTKAFDELGIPLFVAVFAGLIIVPFSTLFEAMILVIFKLFFNISNDLLNSIMYFVVFIHWVIYIYMLIKLMTSPTIISLHESFNDQSTASNDGNKQPLKNGNKLHVKRCIWGDRGSSTYFNIEQGGISINIEQLDQAARGQATTKTPQSGVCVVCQEKTSIRIGEMLNWQELIELKQAITEMIDA